MSRRRPVNDFSGPWKKSSLSGYSGDCVEVAGLAGDGILIRDSKDPRGPILNFTAAQWDAFLGGVHDGAFDRNRQIQ